jgi:hypothetical protein
MKKFKLVQEKKDLFNLYSSVVKDIFTAKNIDVDLTDDDSMADYCMGLHKKGFPNYEFREITQLLMYNSMLQAKASTITEMNFILEREIYVELKK